MDVVIPAIRIEKLSKRYGKSAEMALKELSLQVKPGEVYGFLGPNGAGKSTTIRLLMNFIKPTGGNASILGHDVGSSAKLRGCIGYLAGDVALYPKMTGRQFLTYMRELQPSRNKSYFNDLVKRFDANLNRPIGELSKGNRQKIGLIQAFMHQPEVVILDEPTSGLDPLMQEQFFELVKETAERGASLFISSHNLSDVQKMCDHVGFIRSGKLIAEKTLSELTTSATQTFLISFAGPVPADELKKIKGVKVELNSKNSAAIKVRGNLSALFAVLARHEVRSLNQQETNLEEEFMHFYEGGKK